MGASKHCAAVTVTMKVEEGAAGYREAFFNAPRPGWWVKVVVSFMPSFWES